jgi:ketol-acid reductoisomerase
MAIYRDTDIDLQPLFGKTVAMLGYGNQGRPQALNLRDSGISAIVGVNHPDISPSGHVARSDGMIVLSIPEATARADVIMMMIPDEQMASVYQAQVEPALRAGSCLGFSHGMAIHAKWVSPRPDINVFLVAPKAQGRGVRNRYLAGGGVPGLLAIHQDPAGTTQQVALAYAKAIGCGRAGILETTFAEETECDLFSEQAVLCGGLTQLIKTAFEVLLEAGYAPETAYFECLYEVKLIADLLNEGGITFMRQHISSTARFGDVTAGYRVIDGHVKASMEQLLAQIRSGQFAEAFLREVAAGSPHMAERMAQDFHHPIEETGRRLRDAQIL